MSDTLYLQLDQNIQINHPHIYLQDIAKLSCSNSKILNRLRVMPVINLDPNKPGRYVMSVMDLISEIKQGQGSFRHDNMTGKRCPQCGKFLLAVKGKNSEMLVCQDRECGYRETVARTSNARCPVCHKRMELRGKGDGQIFVCTCGHKEKLSAFKSRREKEGAGISKKDVARYLNRQKREAEEPVNNAFAKALAGIRLDNQ